MNCSDVHELLSAYFDGELTDSVCTKMSKHLRGCSECAQALAGFEKLSTMAHTFDDPVPPADIWNQIAHQLDAQGHDDAPVVKSASSGWSFPTRKVLALAATLLVAVWIGWLSDKSETNHGSGHPFTAAFGHYLDEFRRNPDAAQQFLLAKYDSQMVLPDQAIRQVGYRPAVADGLPEGYQLVSTHIMKMPCCTCVQSLCRRSDGSMLAVFEHDDESTTQWFGDRPSSTVRCNDKECCLVELDDQIAANWKRGTRYVTLIGVRDESEVRQMVAWLDKEKPAVIN